MRYLKGYCIAGRKVIKMNWRNAKVTNYGVSRSIKISFKKLSLRGKPFPLKINCTDHF